MPTFLMQYLGQAVDSRTYCTVNDGKLSFVPVTDMYYTYLEFLAKLYAEGLILDTCFTITGEELTAKGTENDIFGSSASAGIFLVVGRDNDDDYKMLTPFGEGQYAIGNGIGTGVFCVTDKCTNPGPVLAMFDTFYSQEGGILATMGVEGETYSVNEQGEWEWILGGKYGETVDEVRGTGTIQGTTAGPYLSPDIWWTKMSPNADPDKVYLNQERVRTAAYGVSVLPNMHYTEEDEDTVAALATDIQMYFEEYTVEVITGKKDLASTWDNDNRSGISAFAQRLYAQKSHYDDADCHHVFQRRIDPDISRRKKSRYGEYLLGNDYPRSDIHVQCDCYKNLISNSIPAELHNAAKIDGANNLQFLWKIVLPLSKPILAVIGLYYAVGHWNDYYTALIYLYDKKLFPLTCFLKNMIIDASLSMEGSFGASATEMEKMIRLSQSLKYSTIIISVIPLLIIYPFIQKFFVKGVMIGSIIFIKNCRNTVNFQAGFKCRFHALAVREYELRITGATLYSIYLNGSFIFYGPARAPHGYLRVDTVKLYPTEGENTLCVNLAGYNCPSFATMAHPSFLQAEIFENGTSIRHTGRDFSAISLNKLREPKTYRYSYQRAFTEVWYLDSNSALTNWMETDFGSAAAYGAFEPAAKPVVYDSAHLTGKDTSMVCYPASEIRHHVLTDVQGKYTPDSSRNLTDNRYALFDLGRVNTGFIRWPTA